MDYSTALISAAWKHLKSPIARGVHERGEKGDPIFAQDEPALLETEQPAPWKLGLHSGMAA